MSKASAITSEAAVTLKNLSAVILLKAAQYPFLMLAMVLIPRMMGPETYGKYALLISVITIADSLNYLGVGEIFGRFVPEFQVYKDSEGIVRLSSSFLAFKTVTSLILSVFLFAILYAVYGSRFPIHHLLLTTAIVLVREAQSVPYALLFGLNELTKYTLPDPIRRIISLAFITVLFHFWGLVGAIVSALLVESTLTIILISWTRRYFYLKYSKINISYLWPYLKFGLMFYISWALLNIWQRLSNSLIEYITKNSVNVAIFDISNQIFLILTAFTLAITSAMIPVFTTLLLTNREDKLIQWSTMVMKYIAITWSMILLVYGLIGHDLIILLIGQSYHGVFANGILLILAAFPMAIAQLGATLAVVYQKPQRYIASLMMAIGSFTTSSLALVPKYASMGSSAAILISCIVIAVLIGIFFRDQLSRSLVDGFKAIALGAIFVPILWLRGEASVNSLLAILSWSLYVVLLFVTRILNPHEIQEIFQTIVHLPQPSRPSQALQTDASERA